MKFWLTLLFILCPLVAGAQFNETVYSNLSEAQIESHLRGLTDSENAVLHFWALDLIYRTDTDSNGVNRTLQELEYITDSNKYIESVRNYVNSQDQLSLLDVYLKNNQDINILVLRLSQLTFEDRADYIRNYNFEITAKYSRLADYITQNQSLDESFINALDNEIIQIGILYYYYKSSKLLSKDLKKNLVEITEYTKLADVRSDFRDTVHRILAFRASYINNNYGEAVSNLGDLNLRTALPASNFLLNLSTQIRYSYFAEGRYDKAASIYEDYLLPLSKGLSDSATHAHYLLIYGNTLYRTGKISSSQRVYEQLYNGSYSLSPQDSTYLLNNLAATYYKTGESAKYQKLQHDAIQKSKETGKEYLYHFRNLYHFNIRRGNISLALSYLKKTKEIAEKSGDKSSLSNSL